MHSHCNTCLSHTHTMYMCVSLRVCMHVCMIVCVCVCVCVCVHACVHVCYKMMSRAYNTTAIIHIYVYHTNITRMQWHCNTRHTGILHANSVTTCHTVVSHTCMQRHCNVCAILWYQMHTAPCMHAIYMSHSDMQCMCHRHRCIQCHCNACDIMILQWHCNTCHLKDITVSLQYMCHTVISHEHSTIAIHATQWYYMFTVSL